MKRGDEMIINLPYGLKQYIDEGFALVNAD